MISLSWDLFITLCLIAGGIAGFILEREKLAIILTSVYIALAVAMVWGETIYKLISANSRLFGSFSVSLWVVEVALFILFILLLAARGGLSAETKETFWSPFIMAFLGILTVGLILSSIFSFMPLELRENLLSTSRFASLIWRFKAWWVLLPPIVLIITGSFKKLMRM